MKAQAPIFTLLIAIGALLVADGRAIENAKVRELAEEGYWIKSKPEYLETAMGMLGQPPPELPLTDWRGEAVAIEAQKGKILVIDFWATWCKPCIALIPHGNRLMKKYREKGVSVLGACNARGAEKMHETAEANGMEYPSGKMTDAMAQAWNIKFYPTWAVIDRQGRLRAIGVKPNVLESILEELLIEQPMEDSGK